MAGALLPATIAPKRVRLGREHIEAIVIDAANHIETELIEINENLCRAELTPAQRAAAIKRRKQIWEALHPETGKTVSTLGGRGNSSFAADTCTSAGLSMQAVNQHLARAEALGDDLVQVAGTSLDEGVELDALKTLPITERQALIARARKGEMVSARKPKARLNLSIEYLDVNDGAFSLARTIVQRNRDLAHALRDALEKQAAGGPMMDAATLALHEQLLRLAKGMLKAWETWLATQRDTVAHRRAGNEVS